MYERTELTVVITVRGAINDDREANRLLDEWLRPVEDDDRVIEFALDDREVYVVGG